MVFLLLTEFNQEHYYFSKWRKKGVVFFYYIFFVFNMCMFVVCIFADSCSRKKVIAVYSRERESVMF